MGKVNKGIKLKKALTMVGATFALSGAFLFANTQDASASTWQERDVTEIQSDVESQAENSTKYEYTIQWGDTLSNIARVVGVDTTTLANANGIENMDVIIAGDVIYISETVDEQGETHVQVQSSEQVAEEALGGDVNIVPIEEVVDASEPEYVEPEYVEPVQEETAYVEPVQEETTYSANLGTSDAEAKEIIAQRESGGSYTAFNSAGGYYGRYQLNPTLVAYGASPAEQEAAADAYVAERYGTWTNALSFWNANGWY